MTKLCDNCFYFSPIKVQHSWSDERNLGSDPGESAHSGNVDPLKDPHAVRPPREWNLSVDEYRVGLSSIRLGLVEKGADLGCQLCSLLLRAVGPARISAFKTRRGEDGNWIHIRGKPPLAGEGGRGLTHLEVFVDKYRTVEAMYHGRLRLYAEPDSLAAQRRVIRGRRLPNGTSSTFFDWLRETMLTCVNGHRTCGRSLTGTFIAEGLTPLPARVIDVNHDPPRLIETSGSLGAYATLSYCWGASGNLRTTHENIESMKEGITGEGMPTTISSAIMVTRTLKIQYLWIDAICIIQDDTADWTEESKKMGSYYENAIFTIAATAADDVHQAFLYFAAPTETIQMIYWDHDEKASRDFPDCLPRGYYHIGTDVPTFYTSVINSRWSRRGWVVQERYLSRRIIYFARGRVFFECRRPQTLAGDGEQVDRKGLLDDTSDERKSQLVDLGGSFDTGGDESLKNWYRIIETYTTCELTCTTDQLPAVQGMARLFNENLTRFVPRHTMMQFMHDNLPGAQTQLDSSTPTYVSGLWASDIHRGLLWRAEDGIRPSRSGIGAPTWSWAKLSTSVAFPMFVLDALELDCSARLCSTDGEATKPGFQFEKELIVEGNVKPIMFTIEQDLADSTKRRLWKKDRKIRDDSFTCFKNVQDGSHVQEGNIGWGSFEDADLFQGTNGHGTIKCLLISANLWSRESDQILEDEFEPNQMRNEAQGLPWWSERNDIRRRKQHVTYNVIFIREVDSDTMRYVRVGMGEITQRGWWDHGFQRERIILV